MPKCPNCPQFTSKDTDTDPEENTAEIDHLGAVNVEYRVYNSCAECGCELEEYNFQLEHDFSTEVEQHRKNDHPDLKEDDDLELELEASCSRTDEMQNKSRGGKRITNPRYMKRMYGVEVELTVKCGKCEQEIAKQNISDAVQASAFEWTA